jgi:hypothetical protein
MFPPLLLLSYAAILCRITVVAASEENNASIAAVVASPSRPAAPAEIALLNEALHKTAGDFYRWAYTEHRVMRDAKGQIKSEVVLRHDPSKPYAEQWTPIKIDGKEPTQREKATYRRRGEKGADASSRGENTPNPDNRRRRSLGELIDVNNSTVRTETATHLVFEVPLIKVGNERFPPEKFLVLARLKKEGRQLEHVAVRLRDSFRSKVVVKVKSGEGSLDFTVVDAKHPPTLTAIQGGAEASVFFVSVGGSMQLKRTELKHVKPFDERFNVQIGTLKAIDF